LDPEALPELSIGIQITKEKSRETVLLQKSFSALQDLKVKFLFQEADGEESGSVRHD
jgi:hypothetical protein